MFILTPNHSSQSSYGLKMVHLCFRQPTEACTPKRLNFFLTSKKLVLDSLASLATFPSEREKLDNCVDEQVFFLRFFVCLFCFCSNKDLGFNMKELFIPSGYGLPGYKKCSSFTFQPL